MNKSDLVEKIATAMDVPMSQAEKAFGAVFDGISECLSKGEAINIISFGNFTVKDRAERKGRHPQTGETITIQACKYPHFKACKKLKDIVNG